MHPDSKVAAQAGAGLAQPVAEAHRALMRLARLLHLAGDRPRGDAFEFSVDGVAIRAQAQDRHVRLTCILGAPPRDEGALRRLMRRFFRHADEGAQILCATGEGQLALVADLADDAEMAELASNFCDAAVHWSAVTGGGPASLSDDLQRFRGDFIRP